MTRPLAELRAIAENATDGPRVLTAAGVVETEEQVWDRVKKDGMPYKKAKKVARWTIHAPIFWMFHSDLPPRECDLADSRHIAAFTCEVCLALLDCAEALDGMLAMPMSDGRAQDRRVQRAVDACLALERAGWRVTP